MNITQAVEKVRSVCRLRHMSWSTEKTYVGWLRQFAAWVSKTKPDGDARDKVEAFLTFMAKANYSASSQNQAFNALLFFYNCIGIKLENINALRAKKPKRQPYCPPFEEVRRLLDDVQDSGGYPLRMMVRLLYGSGMRLNEVCELRMKDVDLVKGLLTIRQAKGAKDRIVMIPKSQLEPLRIQMGVAAAVADRDRANSIPIHLPDRLAFKYPRMQFSKDWAFVFPGKDLCTFEPTGITGRYCCLGKNIQRAVRASVERLGLNERIKPHALRHGFATHALDRGANIRDLQEILGHNSLETTQVYVHAEVGRVNSPIDAMEISA